ncbi:hypothetical protein BGP75_22620 [Motiliproteus sp. MSK22-1]|nr:hypothetical protein BGP75_22620 [Motiliproteus sp. MSK22-1]
MNKKGLVLELCEKYYAENVLMLSNGEVFAQSMREAYDKQKGYVDSVQSFDVSLVSKKLENNVSELVFHYKMTTKEGKSMEYTGKHVQTWENEKIIKEEYSNVE